MASAGHSDDDDDDDAATSSRGAIMQTPPAAQSLASLTALANSPPTRRPDLQQSFERKGLLLWIVRVPEKKGMCCRQPTCSGSVLSVTVHLYIRGPI